MEQGDRTIHRARESANREPRFARSVNTVAVATNDAWTSNKLAEARAVQVRPVRTVASLIALGLETPAPVRAQTGLVDRAEMFAGLKVEQHGALDDGG